MRLVGEQWVAENDLELIDALHLNPRANFETLGPTLGVSAVTVARRWRRLVENGEAWVSSAPGALTPLAGALVRVACNPARVSDVAASLAALPHVGSIHITVGEYPMYALVAAADPAVLAEVIMMSIGQTPAVTALDTSVLLKLYGGTTWALGALGPSQRDAVRLPAVGNRGSMSGKPLDATERDLYLALQHNGRAGFRDLAAVLASSEKVVKRRLEKMMREGRLSLRTDFVRPAAGWPVQVAMWLNVEDEALDDVARALAAWPETRVCAAIVGKCNLFVTVQLHQLPALMDVQTRLRHQFPMARISDRQVLLRPTKSWGRLLGHDGRATGVVPVDVWAEPQLPL